MTNLAFDLALATIELALERNPDFPPAIYVHAELMQRFGERDRAASGFRRALARGVDDAARKLWLIEGEQALIEGRTVAMTLGGRELRVDPAAPESWETLARGLAADGTPGKALGLLARGLERFPGHPALKRRLAEAELFYGRTEEAAALLSGGDAEAGLIDRLRELQRPARY
jgi:tetratricopeptide (TPR) repeat protein